MKDQADVKSVDTLALVKAALAAFAHETGQALGEVEVQAQRAIDWITVDQAAYWKSEVRRRGEAVTKAFQDLEHCRAYKKVGDNQPSCIEEKKALQRAKQRLEQAETKAEAVRRWTPLVQQQFRETSVRFTRFREVLDSDCPKALGELERMLRALDAYRDMASPAEAAARSAQEQSVARQAPTAPAAGPAPGAAP